MTFIARRNAATTLYYSYASKIRPHSYGHNLIIWDTHRIASYVHEVDSRRCLHIAYGCAICMFCKKRVIVVAHSGTKPKKGGHK